MRASGHQRHKADFDSSSLSYRYRFIVSPIEKKIEIGKQKNYWQKSKPPNIIEYLYAPERGIMLNFIVREEEIQKVFTFKIIQQGFTISKGSLIQTCRQSLSIQPLDLQSFEC